MRRAHREEQMLIDQISRRLCPIAVVAIFLGCPPGRDGDVEPEGEGEGEGEGESASEGEGEGEGEGECALNGEADCAVLAAASQDLSVEVCTACQGAVCGSDRDCDVRFPCAAGVIVIRGCCVDADCADISPFCGQFIAVDDVCVPQDDI